MVAEKLRNYEAVVRRHAEHVFTPPNGLAGLPEYVSVPEDPVEPADRQNDGPESSSDAEEARDR